MFNDCGYLINQILMFLRGNYGYSLNWRSTNLRVASDELLLVPGRLMTLERPFIAILGQGGVFTLFFGVFLCIFIHK